MLSTKYSPQCSFKTKNFNGNEATVISITSFFISKHNLILSNVAKERNKKLNEKCKILENNLTKNNENKENTISSQEKIFTSLNKRKYICKGGFISKLGYNPCQVELEKKDQNVIDKEVENASRKN